MQLRICTQQKEDMSARPTSLTRELVRSQQRVADLQRRREEAFMAVKQRDEQIFFSGAAAWRVTREAAVEHHDAEAFVSRNRPSSVTVKGQRVGLRLRAVLIFFIVININSVAVSLFYCYGYQCSSPFLLS